MAGSLEEEALAGLSLAREKRDALREAHREHEIAYLRFLRDARKAGWPWRRIGGSLGLTEVAVRRHWDRNRLKADRMGRTNGSYQEPLEHAVPATPAGTR